LEPPIKAKTATKGRARSARAIFVRPKIDSPWDFAQTRSKVDKNVRPGIGACEGAGYRHSENEGVIVMNAKSKRITLKDVLKRELKDPEFTFYFQRERAVSEIARLVRDARLKAGLTQAQLAETARSSQVVIARLESGTDGRVPSLELLERIAAALKAKLLVRFEYKKVA